MALYHLIGMMFLQAPNNIFPTAYWKVSKRATPTLTVTSIGRCVSKRGKQRLNQRGFLRER